MAENGKRCLVDLGLWLFCLHSKDILMVEEAQTYQSILWDGYVSKALLDLV